MPRFLADWHSAQSIHLSNLGNDRNLIVLVHHPPPPMYVYQQSHIVRDVEQLLPRETGSCRKKRCKELGACSPHMSITAFVSTLQVPHCDLSMQ